MADPQPLTPSHNTHLDMDDKRDIQLEEGNEKNVTWSQVRSEAIRDEEFQHSLSLWQALKTYKAAVFWSAIISFAIIMESYDTLLLGSLLALPAFQQQFGTDYGGTAGYQIPAPWQAGCQQAANIGSIIGIFWGAWLIDRYGYKKTIIGNMFLMFPCIALVSFAPNLGALLAGELLCGIPWGCFSSGCEAYASEISPVALRGYLTTYVNLCWVIGHFIGAGILRQAAAMTGTWSYRMPFLVQFVWPVILIPFLFFAPESPWWLVRHGRLDQAEKQYRRIAPAIEQGRAAEAISAMVRTNQLEKEASLAEGQTRWVDLFRGTDRRRTEISCIVWATQILCGLQFANYSTYFFQQAGLSTIYSFDMTIGLYAAAFVGTVSSWWLITYVGRRKIWVCGLSALVGFQILIGILSIVADHGNVGARWGQAGVMIVFLFTYDLTAGPLAYVIVGETSSTRLRNKTVGLARATYNCASIGFGVIMPYMLNPTAWNVAGKTGFMWAGIAFLCLVWAFFRLPEMKGRTYYELDILFAQRVPARQFKSAVVDQDADEQMRMGH